jgi:hypothetical protein
MSSNLTADDLDCKTTPITNKRAQQSPNGPKEGEDGHAAFPPNPQLHCSDTNTGALQGLKSAVEAPKTQAVRSNAASSVACTQLLQASSSQDPSRTSAR